MRLKAEILVNYYLSQIIKIGLSKKLEPNPLKVAKEHRQGESLLMATANSLNSSYPIDIDFLLGLPEELTPIFKRMGCKQCFNSSGCLRHEIAQYPT